MSFRVRMSVQRGSQLNAAARQLVYFLLVNILMLASSSVVFAGMPSPLPEDVATVFRLHEGPQQRLQAISFFLFGILVCTLCVRWLWNCLAADFINLPRINLLKSFAIVFMWGALFVTILTMISGARELMTPGAWKKDGITYQLSDSVDDTPRATNHDPVDPNP